MKRSQLLIAVVAVVAVALVASLSGGDGDDSETSGGGSGPVAPRGSVRVSFAYSPEKEKLLKPLIRRFNSQRTEVNGKPVFVEGDVVSSGEAESKLASGDLELTAWSPASSLWGRLLNFEADRSLAADENPSIVRTPLVIAMWEPFARALGWPRKQLGFEQIIQLARSNQGFASRSSGIRSSGASSSFTPTRTSRPRAWRRSSPSTTPPPARRRA
jgi:Ca-activated chloride channel homolog